MLGTAQGLCEDCYASCVNTYWCSLETLHYAVTGNYEIRETVGKKTKQNDLSSPQPRDTQALGQTESVCDLACWQDASVLNIIPLWSPRVG